MIVIVVLQNEGHHLHSSVLGDVLSHDESAPDLRQRITVIINITMKMTECFSSTSFIFSQSLNESHTHVISVFN